MVLLCVSTISLCLCLILCCCSGCLYRPHGGGILLESPPSAPESIMHLWLSRDLTFSLCLSVV